MLSRNPSSCPLCLQAEIQYSFIHFKRLFYQCDECHLIFTDPQHHLTADEEKKRYESHQNNVEDLEYQKFVRPLFNAIKKKVGADKLGLDFGAGTGPVLTKLLSDEGFDIQLYDPFFYPSRQALLKMYDFIFASEVVEHFYHPRREFDLLEKLLSPQGSLFLMTLLYQEDTPKENWFYLKDPTHVCAYSLDTFHWIKNHYGFKAVENLGPRVVVLCK